MPITHDGTTYVVGKANGSVVNTPFRAGICEVSPCAAQACLLQMVSAAYRGDTDPLVTATQQLMAL